MCRYLNSVQPLLTEKEYKDTKVVSWLLWSTTGGKEPFFPLCFAGCKGVCGTRWKEVAMAAKVQVH